MVATSTSTSTSTATTQMVVEHMFDAIENLTDDHVRRHAADPWWDELNRAGREDLEFRIDAALKSLAAAAAELRGEEALGAHRSALELTEIARSRAYLEGGQ